MMPPQTPYMTPPPTEMKPEMQPPVMQRPVSPEYNDQFIESLAQRLMPRLMPEIMYNLRSVGPERLHSKALGLSLALAIVSMAFMIALLGIAIGTFTTFTGAELVPMLFGVGIVALFIVAFNVMYNYLLFNDKSTRV
jgi:hypothetical protein